MDEQTSVAEANGVPALTTTTDAHDLTQGAVNQVSLRDTTTEKPKRKAPRTAFAPGYDPRRNLVGRPKKGESVPELLKRAIERPRVTHAVVDATVKRLLRTDAVGNRAFADVRDTVYGIPKQTLVLEQGEDPLASLYAAIADAGGAVVEGESRLLPAPDADHSPDE